MNVTSAAGNPGIAMVYLAEMTSGKYIEFVESVQPPLPKEEKWVLIVSTLYGCPVHCSICDAGGWYDGPLSETEIMGQIDYMITKYYPDRKIPCKKFKIQFARVGEPSLNPNVLNVLESLPLKYDAPGLIPSISTVAPNGTDSFFDKLITIKENHYSNGRFQMQFSIHTTDPELRDKWIPIKKWSFNKIAEYGKRFYSPGDRKITLNFALAEEAPVSPTILTDFFDPKFFAIKITPVNPTLRAQQNKIVDGFKQGLPDQSHTLIDSLKEKGYDVIVSIGELEENKIGSNCGQYIKRFLDSGKPFHGESYQYKTEPV